MATTHNLSISVPNFPVHVTPQRSGKVIAKSNLEISVPDFPAHVKAKPTEPISELIADKKE